jgi:hypothetical protein
MNCRKTKLCFDEDILIKPDYWFLIEQKNEM